MHVRHYLIYTAFNIDLAIKMSLVYPQLVIATGNIGKLVEFRSMFQTMFDSETVELTSLSDLQNIVEVEETGTTFDENARLKVIGYAKQSGLLTLADDSGLEIKALNGRPGVLSARYGGDISFGERMELLLDELGKSADCRTARFVCSIALATPDGTVVAQESGVCNGKIAFRRKGNNGFGYDPIFIPDGFEMTFGELNDRIKRSFSHRTTAFRKIMPKIGGFIVH